MGAADTGGGRTGAEDTGEGRSAEDTEGGRRADDTGGGRSADDTEGGRSLAAAVDTLARALQEDLRGGGNLIQEGGHRDPIQEGAPQSPPPEALSQLVESCSKRTTIILYYTTARQHDCTAALLHDCTTALLH